MLNWRMPIRDVPSIFATIHPSSLDWIAASIAEQA
jgi:hypothetical protein